MSDITSTQWKYFIKLTLAKPGEQGFEGFCALDVNQRVNMIWNETEKFTLLVLGDGKTTIAVTETPDEICTMVDARIDEEKAKREAEHAAFMAEYEKQKAAEKDK